MRLIFIFLTLLLLGCSAKKQESDLEVNNYLITREWTNPRGKKLTGFIDDYIPGNPRLIKKIDGRGDTFTTPLYFDGSLFLTYDEGVISRIDLTSGEVKWEREFNTAFEASPVILGDFLYIGDVNGGYYKLSIESGDVVWMGEVGGKISGSMAYMSVDDGYHLFFGSYDSNIYSIDSSDGSINWSYSSKSYINGTPWVSGETLLFGGCDNFLYIINIKSGELIDSIKTKSYIPGSPLSYNNKIYYSIYHGILYSYDSVTKENSWSYDNRDAPLSQDITISDNYLIIGSSEGEVVALNRVNGKKLWEFITGDSVESPIIMNRERVVASSNDGYTYILDIESGKELWSYNTGEALSGSPLICDEKLILTNSDGDIYLFKEGER